MNSHGVFIHIDKGCLAGTGAIVRLPQCQWSKPDGYGKISQCITTTKHSKAKTVCIFLGIYCRYLWTFFYSIPFPLNQICMVEMQIRTCGYVVCSHQGKPPFISNLTLEIDQIYSWIVMAEISIEYRSWKRCYCLLLASQDDVLETYTISCLYWYASHVNTLKPRQYCRRFTNDIFKCIILTENAWISLDIELKFVHDIRVHNIAILVQIVAWRRPGDISLSEPMMGNLHTCVTRP